MRQVHCFLVFVALCAPLSATSIPNESLTTAAPPSTSTPAASDSAERHDPSANGSETVDERGTFQASVYLGLVIDSFTAKELRKYLNPEDSGNVRSDRSAFGAVFSYRLFGDPELERPKKNNGSRNENQQKKGPRTRRLNNFWVYGSTLHGVRSSDIDCAATPELPSCKASLGDIASLADPGKPALYILRNATSLEGHAGFRYEFLGLQQQSESPANLYINAKLGFLNVAGSGSDLQDLHHIGIGAVVTKGDYMNSHLEIGYGRSDLYVWNPQRRFKVDGHLQKALPFRDGAVALFIRMFVDSDLSKGADSVQSYAGILFDLGKLLGSPKVVPAKAESKPDAP